MVNKTEASYKEILLLWLPEMITSSIIYSLPLFFDDWVVAQLRSTMFYGTLGVATNMLHSLTKMAEAIPVASVAIIGRQNGAKEYEACGKSLGDTFWTTFLLGITQCAVMFVGAAYIYRWYGVPEEMLSAGIPFLRLRAISVLFVFVFFSFMGFLRAVKNTKAPMYINMLGMVVFMFFDYALVLGKFGFPSLGLNGSSIATILQYGFMLLIASWYVLSNEEHRKYFSQAFYLHFNIKRALHLLNVSWPIIIDKISLSLAYVWLLKLITPMGTIAIASFSATNKLERFALMPAIAFAQVITFLVSNKLGENDSATAKSYIKKVLILTSTFVCAALFTICYKSHYFMGFFDKKGEFTDFVSFALSPISILVVFDFIQIILAGALRGAGDVKAVMWGRFLSCALFFVPVSWLVSTLVIPSPELKFILIYSTLYLTTGVMGIIFLLRIKSQKWDKRKV